MNCKTTLLTAKRCLEDGRHEEAVVTLIRWYQDRAKRYGVMDARTLVVSGLVAFAMSRKNDDKSRATARKIYAEIIAKCKELQRTPPQADGASKLIHEVSIKMDEMDVTDACEALMNMAGGR